MTTHHHRALSWLGACAFGLIATLPATTVAQVASCPFNVSGSGSPNLSVDGVLLARYAQGMRGAALIANVGPTGSLAGAEAAIAANIARLDVDGDGEFTTADAQVISRYLAGFTREAWTSNISLPALAQRRAGTSVESFMMLGCPAPKASARLLQQATFGDRRAHV